MSNRPDDLMADESYRVPVPESLAPPMGFPSDQELTRLANELFGNCHLSGASPFESPGAASAMDVGSLPHGAAPVAAPEIPGYPAAAPAFATSSPYAGAMPTPSMPTQALPGSGFVPSMGHLPLGAAPSPMGATPASMSGFHQLR